MIMHSVHRIVGDIATIAYKFVFLLSVKLSVAGLGCFETFPQTHIWLNLNDYASREL